MFIMPIKIIMIGGIEVIRFISLYMNNLRFRYEEPRIKFSNISNLN